MNQIALLQAFSNTRNDAVDEILHLRPTFKGDFRSFLSTTTGYVTVCVKDGKQFVEVAMGTSPYKKIEFRVV